MTGKNKWLLAGASVGVGLIARKLLRDRRAPSMPGQVALITGGSRGLGLALGREFAREGCKVVICARDSEELQRARRDLERRGAEVLAVSCDVTDREEVKDLIDASTKRFGHIDILVNNAGIIEVGPVQSMAIEDFEKAMDVMFWGAVYPTLAALPGFLKRKSGRIVNITSIGGKVSVPHLLPYTCAKFAATGFSEGLRAELGPEGIAVTTVAPGLMRTGSFLNALFKGDRENEAKWFSLGASLPGISMSADRAARQIVRAARDKESEKILSLPAQLLARVHDMFPGATADLLGGIAGLLLPKAFHQNKSVKGRALRSLKSPVMSALLFLGKRAARRFNQYA